MRYCVSSSTCNWLVEGDRVSLDSSNGRIRIRRYRQPDAKEGGRTTKLIFLESAQIVFAELGNESTGLMLTGYYQKSPDEDTFYACQITLAQYKPQQGEAQ